MAIAGVIVPEAHLFKLTSDWIALKRDFWPSIRESGNGWHDAILHDVKGAKLRDGFRPSASKSRRQHAIGFLDSYLDLLAKYEVKVTGRIYVKALNSANDDMSMHSSALQFICGAFHSTIPTSERGMVVVDSQTYRHNHQLPHSIFTQRFGRKKRLSRLVDMPVFGHSDNHAGLQLADVLCSALLAPISCAVFAEEFEGWNIHCDRGFLDLRERYGDSLKRLTFKWHNARTSRKTSSVVVDDQVGKTPTSRLWRTNSL